MTIKLHGGLVVTMRDSRWSDPGLSMAGVTLVVFLGKALYYYSAPLSNQIYKWVSVFYDWGGGEGGNPLTDLHPIQQEVKVLQIPNAVEIAVALVQGTTRLN